MIQLIGLAPYNKGFKPTENSRVRQGTVPCPRYLQSRYYDPNTGRFINGDDASYVAVTGGNLFNYCDNCPTKNADYSGFYCTPVYPEESGTTNSSVNSSKTAKKKHFDIPTWTVSAAIDLVIALMNPVVSASYSTVTGSIIGILKLKFLKNYAVKLIRSVVPTIKGILSGILTFVRKAIWQIAGVTLYFLADGVFSAFLDKLVTVNWIFELIDNIATILSVGGIMALLLDIATDGIENDKIRLW